MRIPFLNDSKSNIIYYWIHIFFIGHLLHKEVLVLGLARRKVVHIQILLLEVLQMLFKRQTCWSS